MQLGEAVIGGAVIGEKNENASEVCASARGAERRVQHLAPLNRIPESGISLKHRAGERSVEIVVSVMRERELLHRRDLDMPRPASAAEADLPELELPGKRTEVERWLRRLEQVLPRPGTVSVPGRWTRVDQATARLGFDDYRVLALRDVLQRLGVEHSLHREVLAAADPTIARRAMRSAFATSGAPPAASGWVMWQAAERHAVTLYRHAVAAGEVDEHDPAIAAALEQRGSGQPLPDEIRRVMEAELGTSLARVRVHTDSVAAEAARAVRANAFTIGEDIFFAEHAFAPDTPAGRRLLAHELAHVAQAARGRAEATRGGMRVSQPGEPLEREADEVAESMARHLERPGESLSLSLSLSLSRVDPLGARVFEAQSGRQRKTSEGLDIEERLRTVARGVRGMSRMLPYREELEQSFGVSLANVSAHVGAEAEHAARERGASAQRGLGHAGDHAETEADAAADAVVDGRRVTMAGAAPVQLQRDPAAYARRAGDAVLAEQWLDMAVRPDLYADPVQRKSAGSEIQHESAFPMLVGGSGQSMPAAVQAKMEDALGADFSAVRIHEGPQATVLGALAFTQGTDIHFAPGQYDPSSERGQELLGHELTHVVQQAQGRVAATAQTKGVSLNDDAALEREADELGAKAARHQMAPSRARTIGLAARAEGGGDASLRPPGPNDGAVTKRAIEASRTLTTIRPGPAPDVSCVQRFEAPVHEAAERQGLTSDSLGNPAANGLTNEEASAVYFGNWMRDLNQVLVPLVTSIMPPEVAFSALALMASKKFGRAITPEQVGYYVPAEHIDSPAGLTDQDDLLPQQPSINAPTVPGAQPRPDPYVTPQESVDPRAPATSGSSASSLLAVDQTGTAAWIRRTNLHVERRLELAARRGRNPEGFVHFGAALHAVEDLFAHSNWIEIAINQLLGENPALLPSLQGSARQVFTYSATQDVGRDARGQPIRRPVLMTGSFIGADTQISLTSEFTKFLSTPLSPPASAEERRVEERFVTALLRTYEAQLSNDPNFANGIRGILRENGVPALLIPGIMNAPLADIYVLTRLPVPDAIRNRVLNPIQAFIRGQLSTRVLQPIARRLQAEALNARVADTSLIPFLRQQEQRRTQTVAQISAAERRQMETVQRFTGRTLDQQNAATQAAAGRHAAALQSTPERIVAGPSHSQISKDHPNSPFFGIAFRVASEAVRRLRERMIPAWNELAGGTAGRFDFGWNNFPAVAGVPADQSAQAEENRRLYHATRPQRGEAEGASLERGNRIVAQGGDVHVQPGQPAPRFQPYDIAAMRRDSAERIREAARGLRAAAGAPSTVASALQRLRQLIGLLDAQTERTRQAQEWLDRTAASLARAGAQADSAAGLNSLADVLDGHAGRVEGATTIEQRRAVNAQLVSARESALGQLAQSPGARNGLAASILVVLDDVIAETTPAYTWEQRAVIEGAQLHGHTGPAGPLPTTVINLGDPATATDPTWNGGQRPPAVAALIQESRLLLNHPFENRWWVTLVTDHVHRNQAQLLADIEARNLGYATLRRPGEQREGH